MGVEMRLISGGQGWRMCFKVHTTRERRSLVGVSTLILPKHQQGRWTRAIVVSNREIFFFMLLLVEVKEWIKIF